MNKIYKIFFLKKPKTLVHLFFPHLIAAVELEVSHLFFSNEYLEFSHLVLILLHPVSPFHMLRAFIVPGSPFISI